VENKAGRSVICGKIICDATADADVAASAGAPFIKGQGDEKQLFAMTMLVRLSNVNWPKVSEFSKTDPGWDTVIARAMANGDLPYYSTRTREMVPYWGHPRPELAHLWWDDGALLWGGTVVDVDGTNPDDLTRAEVESRKQWMSEYRFLKKYVPGFGAARIEDSGVTVGVRDTRHVLGEYTYCGHDILEERDFEDTAAYIAPLFLGVPYRCLVPKEVENLVIGCRAISTTPGQTSSGPTLGSYNDMKSIPTVLTYGEAAGTAAALCAQQGVTPRVLDVKCLQATLKQHGAFLERSAIDALMVELRLPDGSTYRDYLTKRYASLRDHWQTKGYRFFETGETKSG
jgi:hypothetical protein